MTPIPRPCLRCNALTTSGSYCPTCQPKDRRNYRDRRGIGGWEWARIRAAIRERDDHRCVRCGNSHGLQVHHIRPIAHGGDNSPDNLITLCHACHQAAHRS